MKMEVYQDLIHDLIFCRSADHLRIPEVRVTSVRVTNEACCFDNMTINTIVYLPTDIYPVVLYLYKNVEKL